MKIGRARKQEIAKKTQTNKEARARKEKNRKKTRRDEEKQGKETRNCEKNVKYIKNFNFKRRK